MTRALSAIAALTTMLVLFTAVALMIAIKYDVSHVMTLGDIKTDPVTTLWKSMFNRYPTPLEHFTLQTSVATETPATIEQRLKEKSHEEKIMKQLKNIEPFLPKGSTLLDIARTRLLKSRDGFSGAGAAAAIALPLEEVVAMIALKEMKGKVEGFDAAQTHNESYLQAVKQTNASMDELMRGGVKAQGTPLDTNPTTLRSDAFATIKPNTMLTVEENEMLNSSPITQGLNRLANRSTTAPVKKEAFETSALPQFNRETDLVPNYERTGKMLAGAPESNNMKSTVSRTGVYNEIVDSGRYADTSVEMGVPGPVSKQALLARQQMSMMDKLKAVFVTPAETAKPLPKALPIETPQLNNRSDKEMDTTITVKVPEYSPQEDLYTMVNDLEESVDPVAVSMEAGMYDRDRGVTGLTYACAAALPPAPDMKFDTLSIKW